MPMLGSSTIPTAIGMAGLEDAELLELLGRLQRGGGQRGQAEQEVAAVGVEAQVEVAPSGGPSRVGQAVAVVGDRAPREVEGAAARASRRP